MVGQLLLETSSGWHAAMLARRARRDRTRVAIEDGALLLLFRLRGEEEHNQLSFRLDESLLRPATLDARRGRPNAHEFRALSSSTSEAVCAPFGSLIFAVVRFSQ